MNPLLGEVSRALKNRCVELYYTGHKILFDIKNENNNIEENIFNISGNFRDLKIKLFEYGFITINTYLFFDLINLCQLPFYLSLIYLLFILLMK